MSGIKLTWDYRSVADANNYISVMTKDGLFNARICATPIGSKYPVLEWKHENKFYTLETEADYERYKVEGFYKHIPNRKKGW